jgi:hypothetical protein
MAFSKLTHMWDKVKENVEVIDIIVRNDPFDILQQFLHEDKLQLSLEQKKKVANWFIVKGDPFYLRCLLLCHRFLLSPEQEQEVANKIIVKGDLLNLLEFLKEYQLSSEQKQKVENKVMVETDKMIEGSNHRYRRWGVWLLVKHLLSIQPSTEQYTKVVDRMIETDSDLILEILEESAIKRSTKKKSNTIFSFFGQLIPRLSIEALRAIVKMASRRQVQLFLNKYSSQLDEPQSDIVEEKLSVIESLTQLCCERLQQPDISQKTRDEFNARMKLEGAFHSLIYPKVDV